MVVLLEADLEVVVQEVAVASRLFVILGLHMEMCNPSSDNSLAYAVAPTQRTQVSAMDLRFQLLGTAVVLRFLYIWLPFPPVSAPAMARHHTQDIAEAAAVVVAFAMD